ncbi:MAG: carboxypeptidase regulatory-like domain-containing protein [Pyrinomonadaceae bacterium]
MSGVLLFSNPAVKAQSPVSGGFAGQVTDISNGQVLPGATVRFVNQTNGFRTARKSDETGYFRQDTLQPGVYEIEVTLEGYKTARIIQELYATRSNQIVPLPVQLEKEAAVASNPDPTPSPVTTTTTTSNVKRAKAAGTDGDEVASLNPRRDAAFNERDVRTLPLGGTTLTRTFDELAFLAPGVAPPPQAIGNSVGPGVGGGVGTSGQFAVNGLRSRANNFTVDGSDNNDEDIGVRRQGFFSLVPQPIESIQEFSIITLLAPAEFGRNLGAQVNALSKGGGNDFHGTIYGFGNADFLNARNFFDNTSGDTTNALEGIRRNDRTSIPVFLFDASTNQRQPLNVTNGAGEKDTFSLLQGGFAVGGPIRREKLFFFASGEGQHMDGVRERHFAVPTVEQRGLLGFGAEGLFGNGQNNTAFPVFPTNLNGDTIFSLFPFPNDPTGIYGRNTYTKALSIDARGVILSGKVDYNFFKDTERPQVLTARYNYTDDKRDLTDVGGAIFSAIRPLVRTDNFSTFLTGSLSTNLSNEFRFSWGRTRLKFEELRDDFLRPITSLNSSEDTRFLLNAPIILNTTRPSCFPAAVPCLRSNLTPSSAVNYVRSTVNTEDFSLGPVGQVIIAGFSPVGVDVFNFPQERKNDTFQFADTLRQQFNAKGQHSLAFGADIRRVYLDSDLPRNSRPLVTFYGGNCFNVATLCGQTAGFAQPLDFVATGAPTGFSQSLVAPGKDAAINLSYNQLNFFVQDEWRAARNLTFNFGVRYELNTTPKEADKKIEQTFGQTLPSFLSGLSQFISGRTNIYESDRNNFAPRLGFAYSPNSNTVIRGGVGMYYDQILGAVVSQSRNVFPTFTTANFGGGTFSNNAGIFTLFNPRYAFFDTNGQGRTIICNISNIVLGLPVGDCNPNTSVSLVQPGTLNTINPNLTSQQSNTILGFLNSIFPSGSLFETTLPSKTLDTPLSYQYSIGVEQKLLKNTFLSVAYVGTTGRNLLRFTTPNLGGNAASRIDGFFYDDFNCNFDPTNPLFCRPIAAQGTVSGGTPSFSPRRFPNAGVINQFETTGRSQYHSLQVELHGRLTRSFQYRTNYVYGNVKDDVSDVFDLAGAFALPQNSVTFAGEYAPANFDVRHRFTYNFVYETPEFRNQNDFVRFLLGGWQIAGTGKFNTGQPFTVNSIFDRNQDGNLTDRLNNTQFITVTEDRRQPLNRTCDPNLGNCRAALAAFGADGSVPRNSFRAGSILDLDLSFIKRFALREGQTVQFRTDIFNFINRANFGVPVRFLEATGFGQATDTVTPGRRFQFAVKYIF